VKRPEPIAFRNYPDQRYRRTGPLAWRWSIYDGMAGPLLATGTAHTERAARRRMARNVARCMPYTPVVTDALVDAVLARFAVELREAGPDQLVHLACRAEGRYRSAVGDRMRALVDAEYAARRKAGA